MSLANLSLDTTEVHPEEMVFLNMEMLKWHSSTPDTSAALFPQKGKKWAGIKEMKKARKERGRKNRQEIENSD